MPPIRISNRFTAASDRTSSPTPIPGFRRSLRSQSIDTASSLSVLSSYDTDQDDVDLSRNLCLEQARSSPRRSRTSSKYMTIPPTRQVNGSSTRNPASPLSLKSITIMGQLLKPTVAFDTFWRFAAERNAIDDRRRSGQSAPWTTDHILQKYPFCNTYRVLDRVTQYIISEVIEKGPQDCTEVVFRVTLFNIFTKIETWELLRGELGPLTWSTYDQKKYQAVFALAKRNRQPLYTGAFIKGASKWGFSDNPMNHLCLLENFMGEDLPGRILNTTYLADLFEWIISFPGMGHFTTYQLLLNLSYTKYLNFSGMDFVVSGPGSSSGLFKMFGRSIVAAKESVEDFEVHTMRWLAETQTEHFDRLGLNFSGLGPARLPMQLADIEHTLCEVDKYSRIAHPSLKGNGNQRKGKMCRRFKPSNEELPKARLPSAWSHPERKVVRIRPGRPLVDQRYIISRIAGKRKGLNGMEYKIFWFGYKDEDATWEPEALLAMDSPRLLNEYLDSTH